MLSQVFWVDFFPIYIKVADGLSVSPKVASIDHEFIIEENSGASVAIYQTSGFDAIIAPDLSFCDQVSIDSGDGSCHKILSQSIKANAAPLSSKLIIQDEYPSFCGALEDSLSELGDYFIRLVPEVSESKGTVLLLHGRDTTPANVVGPCDVDYMHGAASYWLYRGYQVFIPKVASKVVHNEEKQSADHLFLKDLSHLSYISTSIEKEFKVSGPVIIYGISYGDALANMTAYTHSRLFSHYISSGGIWRTDIPENIIGSGIELNFFYHAESWLLESQMKSSLVSSSYDWGRISRQTKAMILARIKEGSLNVRIFSGLHESNPSLELGFVEGEINE